jgi:HD-GYP domain-containing protein (c-di-GMP phosphodiesterase class II)
LLQHRHCGCAEAARTPDIGTAAVFAARFEADSMMDQKRLSIADFVIGEPLPWDVYAEGNRLLLRRGHIVESLHQVEELVQRGLFIDGGQADRLAHAKNEERNRKQDIPSAVRFINLANKRLERLLYNLGNETDAQAKILEVVKALVYATDINPDIALACIFLNQAAANYAVRHCVDTALLALQVARAMQKPPEDIQSIMAAALTMNIGMLRQQDQLQNKREPLTEKEIEFIRQHPAEGTLLLQQAGITDSVWLSYVRLHHENCDGSGYPLGSAAGEIPQSARIVAMADRYCASVAHRKYRKTLLPGAVLRDVFLAGGKASDPTLAAYFIKELGTCPPGTFVRLQNGEIGVVTRKTRVANAPVVHSLIGPRGAPLSFPIQRDTSKELYALRESVSGEQATLRFSMHQLWGDEAAL